MGMYVTLSLLASAGFFVFALGFQRIGDGLYQMVKNWKLLLPISCILFSVAIMTFGKDSLGNSYQALSWRFSVFSGKTHPSTLVAECKDFVSWHTIKQSGVSLAALTSNPAAEMPPQYWDHCARVFGQNYWKYDTNIGGLPGGLRLCDAYSKSGYKSAKVDSWCETVFSGKATPRHQAPARRRI